MCLADEKDAEWTAGVKILPTVSYHSDITNGALWHASTVRHVNCQSLCPCVIMYRAEACARTAAVRWLL